MFLLVAGSKEALYHRTFPSLLPSGIIQSFGINLRLIADEAHLTNLRIWTFLNVMLRMRQKTPIKVLTKLRNHKHNRPSRPSPTLHR